MFNSKRFEKMKVAYTFIILTALLFCACKKKKAEEPAEPVVQTKQFSAKLNGTEFNCNSCGNTYYSGGLYGVNISESSTRRFLFNFNSFPKPGTYTLTPFSSASFTYERDGTYFRGRGTLT